MNQRFLLIIWNDVEPEVFGPYATTGERDDAARRMREQNGDKHGIFPLDLSLMMPVIGTYPNAFFEEHA